MYNYFVPVLRAKRLLFKTSLQNSTIRNITSRKCHIFPLLSDTLNIIDVELSNAKEKSQRLLQLNEMLKHICLQGGGEKGQTLHVKKNKKILPREKLKLLFDNDSETLEIALQAGLGMEYGDIPGASAICQIGKIHDRFCLVTINDGTLKGGTFFPITVKKTLRAQELCHINHIPKVYLVDSGGGFLPLQSDLFPDKNHGGRGFYNQAVEGSRGIPQLALVCGSCTAGGAYVPMMCDESAIVHKIGTIFLGGPPLVKAATGEDISAEDLGGASVHCSVSGCSDYFANTEEEGFEILRDTVATLDISPPFSRQDVLPLYDSRDLDIVCGLDRIDKSRLMGVIARLVDGSRFREFKQKYGQNLLAGYGFINQICVGILANCGPLTYEDGLKGSHFIQICNQRNLPLLFLQNSGPQNEFAENLNSMSQDESEFTLRGRAAMISALSCADVPKVAVNIGGCHGDDNYTMCGPSFQPNFNFCWPGAQTALYPKTKSTVEDVKFYDPDNENAKKSKKPLSAFTFAPESCWFMASRALVDGIISPSESRKVISNCFGIFDQKKRLNCREVNTPMLRF